MTDTVAFVDANTVTLLRRRPKGKGAESFAQVILPTSDRDEQARIVFGMIDLLAPPPEDTSPAPAPAEATAPAEKRRGKAPGQPAKLTATQVTDGLWSLNATTTESAVAERVLYEAIEPPITFEEFRKLVGGMQSPSRGLFHWRTTGQRPNTVKYLWLTVEQITKRDTTPTTTTFTSTPAAAHHPDYAVADGAEPPVGE